MASSSFDYFVFSHLIIILLCKGAASGEPQPPTRFTGSIGNVTVELGKNASFSCKVEYLRKNNTVTWIHLNRKLVAVGTSVMVSNHRFSVSQNFLVWTLHIASVIEEDSGYYMCQVNTAPTHLSQKGYLRVLVSPEIIDERSSKSEIRVKENARVVLKCFARGIPVPRIMWKRENGAVIDPRNPEAKYRRPHLKLRKVRRSQMGAYLCIAFNGVLPAVSKRITLEVEFSPRIHIPHQRVGVPKGGNITIECFIEAFPIVMGYWVSKSGMIVASDKYHSEIHQTLLYRTHMKLTIFNFSSDDYTTYTCVAKNCLGEVDGEITINEILTTTHKHEEEGGGDPDVEIAGSPTLHDPGSPPTDLIHHPRPTSQPPTECQDLMSVWVHYHHPPSPSRHPPSYCPSAATFPSSCRQ